MRMLEAGEYIEQYSQIVRRRFIRVPSELWNENLICGFENYVIAVLKVWYRAVRSGHRNALSPALMQYSSSYTQLAQITRTFFSLTSPPLHSSSHFYRRLFHTDS
jgi:hypothetical protein